MDYKLKYDLYCKGFDNNHLERTQALNDRGTQTKVDQRNISTVVTDTTQSNDLFRVQQN